MAGGERGKGGILSRWGEEMSVEVSNQHKAVYITCAIAKRGFGAGESVSPIVYVCCEVETFCQSVPGVRTRQPSTVTAQLGQTLVSLAMDSIALDVSSTVIPCSHFISTLIWSMMSFI